MSRRPSRWFVVGALALALGVLLTLRLASTVTSPVGGYAPTRPSSGTTSGVVPTVTDLRGRWLPRVVTGRRVPVDVATKGAVEFRVPQRVLVAPTGCGDLTAGFTVDSDGGFALVDAHLSTRGCSGRLYAADAVQHSRSVRLVAGQLQLLGPAGTVLAVLDRAR